MHAHGALKRWIQLDGLDPRLSLTGGVYRVKGYLEGVPDVNMRIPAPRRSPPLLNTLELSFKLGRQSSKLDR